VTAASAAIAMCGCGGIVVVQKMVTAMKWRCKLDAPVRAGVCPPFVCVAALWCVIRQPMSPLLLLLLLLWR
jgi:hypothetical protein